MSTCTYLIRALILGYFVISAYNTFKNPNGATEQFKDHYANFEQSLKTRFKISLPQPLQSSNIRKHAFEIVYYKSVALMFLCLLGIFSGFASGLAAILYFKFQMISMNVASLSLTSTSDLEKVALPVSLLVAVLAFSCSGSCKVKPHKEGKHSNNHDPNVQSSNKRRH